MYRRSTQVAIITLDTDDSLDETAQSERGTCRTCGALFVLYGGFIPTHYDGKNVRCPGSRDVSREYSEANQLSEADLWRRFEGD
jgi:hypothetical protein